MKKVLHNAGEVTWLMVEVHNDAYDVRLSDDGIKLEYWLDLPIGLAFETKELPLGPWEYVGKGDSIGEEQAADIVDELESDEGDICFRNYTTPESGVAFGYATLSLESLLKSHGMQPSNCVILKQVKL